MWPGEFFSLAPLLIAYEGAVAGRYAREKEEAQENDPAREDHLVAAGIIERG